jgi:hypothetical protein
MANTGVTQKSSRTRQNRLFILLLVLAAVSSVAKDFDRLQRLSSGIQVLTGSFSHLASAVHASGRSAPATTSCPVARGEQFEQTGQEAAGQLSGIEDINKSRSAEPTVGGDLGVVATKKAHRSYPAAANKVKVNRELAAKRRNANGLDSLEFKIVNDGIDLNWSPTPKARIETVSFNPEVPADLPLTFPGRISRKHTSGGYEQLLKTLNAIRIRPGG